MPVQPNSRKIGAVTATSIVVGNMVGTGIFTTTGLILADVHDPLAVLVVWLIGGLAALCGALTYGELSAAMPHSGGEYYYLSRLYHPLVGFISGWISLIVGFSAPIAAVAIAFAKYTQQVINGIPEIPTALITVLVLSVLHLWYVKIGSQIHNGFTWVKVLLIMALIVGGILMASNTEYYLAIPEVNESWRALLNPAFATSLIFVMYAYSGWNAAAYLGGEIKQPERNLPLALIAGTLIVTILYLGLNFFYLAYVPAEQLSGKVEVAHYAAKAMLGPTGSAITSVIVAMACLSSISAMMMSGPRIYQKIGEDHAFFQLFSKRSSHGAPYVAILTQMVIAQAFILTLAFDTILTYVGFTLSLFASLAVGGIFILRSKSRVAPASYQTWGYPILPALFILVMAWMMGHTLFTKPIASLTGIGTMAVGAVIYYAVKAKGR